MNFDLGADTFEGKRISQKSRSIAKEIVGDDSLEDKVRQRVVIATGDPNFKDLLVFSHDPIGRGIKAINEGRSIFTDINMVKVGISKKGHKCSIHCVLDFLKEEANETRTSSGFMSLAIDRFTDGESKLPEGQRSTLGTRPKNELDGSVIVIGNSPSATITVCDLIEKGLKPSLVLATPVGFVNATESKERMRSLNIPSITSIGTRGGSAVAVAIVNELIRISNERSYK
jgi:precorrin-8X/cobalt-precorrin-8 methylmutase